MLQVLVLGENGQIIKDCDREDLKDLVPHESVHWDDINDTDDLIILNSNLKLTSGWVQILFQEAYSFAGIGTVSPMLLQDFIHFAEDKSAHYGEVTMEQWCDIIKSSAVENDVSVGWNLFDCVYIKKEVLSDVGIPTKEIVTDKNKAKRWFLSATQFGWSNKVAITAIAYGDLQYGKNDDYYARINSDMRRIFEHLWKGVDLYFELHFDNDRVNILHYLLADFQEGRENNVGGTQFHVSDLVEYQKYRYNVFVLARDGEYLRLTEYVDDDQKQFDFWVGSAQENVVFYDKRHEDLYKNILKFLDIQIVHIHHIMWMTLDIFYVAHSYHIPIILSIHDYYFVCPVLKMINLENQLCTKGVCENHCEQCLKSNKNIIDGKSYIRKWRKECGKAMDMCAKIIFPSNNTLQAVQEFYPQIDGKSRVIEHGLRLPKEPINLNYNHEKLHVAFIGGISDVKGGSVIYDLIRKDTARFEWYVMGGIAYTDLALLEQKNLTKTGWYKRYEIYELLKEYEIDIVCILSIVAETFCYTLSEAAAMRIPVIAKRVGALGDRAEKMHCGWVVPRDADAGEIYSLLCRLDSNRAEYYSVRENMRKISNKNIDEMGKEYDDVYGTGQLTDRKVQQLGKMLQYEPSCKDADADNIKYYMQERTRLLEAEKELSTIKNLYLVQVILKLYALDSPFWRKVKNFIRRRIKV